MSALHESMNQLKSSNELLSLNIKKEIGALTSSVKSETAEKVDIALKENIKKLDHATQKLVDYNEKIKTRMEKSLGDFQEKQRKLFEFDDVRSFLFWIGIFFNILTFVLLLYFCFFKAS
jgi:putative cell wall-binding protein